PPLRGSEDAPRLDPPRPDRRVARGDRAVARGRRRGVLDPRSPARPGKDGIMIHDRDYTLIIDKSGSMSITDQPGGRSRWAAAEEGAVALAQKCSTLDPDGITLYLFA